jgi:hypothetical protein
MTLDLLDAVEPPALADDAHRAGERPEGLVHAFDLSFTFRKRSSFRPIRSARSSTAALDATCLGHQS